MEQFAKSPEQSAAKEVSKLDYDLWAGFFDDYKMGVHFNTDPNLRDDLEEDDSDDGGIIGWLRKRRKKKKHGERLDPIAEKMDLKKRLFKHLQQQAKHYAESEKSAELQHSIAVAKEVELKLSQEIGEDVDFESNPDLSVQQDSEEIYAKINHTIELAASDSEELGLPDYRNLKSQSSLPDLNILSGVALSLEGQVSEVTDPAKITLPEPQAPAANPRLQDPTKGNDNLGLSSSSANSAPRVVAAPLIGSLLNQDSKPTSKQHKGNPSKKKHSTPTQSNSGEARRTNSNHSKGTDETTLEKKGEGVETSPPAEIFTALELRNETSADTANKNSEAVFHIQTPPKNTEQPTANKIKPSKKQTKNPDPQLDKPKPKFNFTSKAEAEAAKTGFSTAELLSLGKNIMYHGQSIQDIFDQDRITRSGLQEVVRAYLSGGPLKASLKKNILDKATTPPTSIPQSAKLNLDRNNPSSTAASKKSKKPSVMQKAKQATRLKFNGQNKTSPDSHENDGASSALSLANKLDSKKFTKSARNHSSKKSKEALKSLKKTGSSLSLNAAQKAQAGLAKSKSYASSARAESRTQIQKIKSIQLEDNAGANEVFFNYLGVAISLFCTFLILIVLFILL